MSHIRLKATAFTTALLCCIVWIANYTALSTQAEAIDSSDFVNEVIYQLNEFRMENGMAPMKTTPVLLEAAEQRANELTAYYSHTRPDGSSWFTIVRDYGFNTNCYAGENIAAGYPSPETVIEGWKNSPNHRAAMLNTNYTYVAVGHAFLENDPEYYFDYWEMLFLSSDVPLADEYYATKTEEKISEIPATTTTITSTTTGISIENTLLIGDVDLNGTRNLTDWVIMNKYIMGAVQLSDIQLQIADCYQDGMIDDLDCTVFMKFLLNLIPSIPVKEF